MDHFLGAFAVVGHSKAGASRLGVRVHGDIAILQGSCTKGLSWQPPRSVGRVFWSKYSRTGGSFKFIVLYLESSSMAHCCCSLSVLSSVLKPARTNLKVRRYVLLIGASHLVVRDGLLYLLKLASTSKIGVETGSGDSAYLTYRT